MGLTEGKSSENTGRQLDLLGVKMSSVLQRASVINLFSLQEEDFTFIQPYSEEVVFSHSLCPEVCHWERY